MLGISSELLTALNSSQEVLNESYSDQHIAGSGLSLLGKDVPLQ